ncbi:MAG: hypothetical protein LBR56_04785 [Sporomusaceae bacterium]|jgi:hypothetical protein|nr:hypothetical protein [Sporomusaceae bacterium]
MEIIREVSERHRERQVWLVAALAVLGVWLGLEAQNIMGGKMSLLGLGYIGFFAVVLIWQFAFRYTCILLADRLVVVSEWCFIRRVFEVGLEQTESFSNKYVKSFFRKTGIRGYAHRCSAFDGRQKRVLVYNKNGKMYAVLFKASDEFMEELQKMMPEKFLYFEDKKK